MHIEQAHLNCNYQTTVIDFPVSSELNFPIFPEGLSKIFKSSPGESKSYDLFLFEH